MSMRFMTLYAFASVLLCGSVFGQSTAVVPYQEILTTGFVGFTTNQTARLSVLNLNPQPPVGALGVAPCTVEMQFFDLGNNQLGTPKVVSGFAPQTGVLLDLDRASANLPGVASTPRAQIRGLVTINPTAPAPGTAQGPCRVMVTLEIVDASGSTVSLTSETSTVGNPVVSFGRSTH